MPRQLGHRRLPQRGAIHALDQPACIRLSSVKGAQVRDARDLANLLERRGNPYTGETRVRNPAKLSVFWGGNKICYTNALLLLE